ncbi:FadR family transcriptional regulator [Cryobacterium sp. TMT1-21]|uniref:FadR family transcriptional regulator n=1 Tax=Cryobacterium shii TaxID=1259235 RepID=A0AAQ2C6Y8_9MICO|nr:FadR family transcriptional regulator [Cryobacterium shii]TFC83130.1 FadR family transcriptional regulator [Cryobacterium sp. TmT2-59]TFD08679.1 FadR family transcriptional regulator [Cryobacterium sp. TMT1-21]TFD15556.1 FadR family transcriptional regulator [Cryobacterium sp. TMT4-10]TFD15890.1 FadR family transcriptional regulator [Cryobacterium sp. TMT2-23]TFD38584.1 FadR family transcriptional regulator [Cryobacterium sp. TMT2-10]
MLQSIESDLLSGRLRPGDHLQPERALAADLGVGRSSVREAIRVLEVLGLLRTAVGSGPSAGAIIVALPGGGMAALMRLQVAAQGFPVIDVVKTRLVLEASVVTELAEASALSQTTMDANASLRPDLTAALQLLAAMDSRDLTEAEFLALDAEFHLALAEASGNQVVTATMAGLRSTIEAYVQDGASSLASWTDTSARLRTEHRAVLSAIEAGDAEAARSLVTSHIAGYYAETQPNPQPTDQHTDAPGRPAAPTERTA